MSIRNNEYINIADRIDPYEQFIGMKVVVTPLRGRPFEATLIEVTASDFVFGGLHQMRSIYRREAVLQLFAREAV